MFDFDKIIERQSDKCRKWDHTFVCSRFGDVPESFIPLWILHDSRRLAAPALPPAAREELHYLAQFVRDMGNHSGLSTRSALARRAERLSARQRPVSGGCPPDPLPGVEDDEPGIVVSGVDRRKRG